MELLFTTGRVILGLFFVFYGLNNLFTLQSSVAYATYKRMPLPWVSVPVGALLLLAGGASILFQYETVRGSVLLAIFLVAAALKMHDFWAQSDPNARSSEMAHFLKNVALAAATLAVGTL